MSNIPVTDVPSKEFCPTSLVGVGLRNLSHPNFFVFRSMSKDPERIWLLWSVRPRPRSLRRKLSRDDLGSVWL